MNRHAWLRCVPILLAALLAGCGDGKVPVEGTVRLDGEPIPDGAILFVREDPPLREGAVIQDGAFKARVPPGRYRLELNSQKVVGKRKQIGFDGKEEELPITAERFPEWFNTKTQLSEEIRADMKKLELDLKSKK